VGRGQRGCPEELRRQALTARGSSASWGARVRTFVTGGAGFIGSHTVARLLEAGHEVQVWDDLSTGKRENIDFAMGQIALLEGDIRDFVSLDSAVSHWRPDAILHLAAIPSVPRSVEEPRLTHAVNLTGTLNVLEIARRQGIQRVVLACSAAIFGNEPEVPKRETSPASPSSPYGLEKWQSEQYAALYSELFGLATVSLRYFNVFGPRQDPKSPYSGVISIFLDRVLSGRQVIIDGTGEQTRDFIFVADVAEANLLALTSEVSGHQRFNIGRGEETSVVQLFDLICQVVGGKPEPAFGPPRPGDVYRSCADAARATASLGFAPRYTVREGLELLVDWYKSANA
jgi:nucleoside-diphosphate-sugar epimerase